MQIYSRTVKNTHPVRPDNLHSNVIYLINENYDKTGSWRYALQKHCILSNTLFLSDVVLLFNFHTLADSHVKFYAWIIGLDDFFTFDSLFSIEITSIYQHQCKYE